MGRQLSRFLSRHAFLLLPFTHLIGPTNAQGDEVVLYEHGKKGGVSQKLDVPSSIEKLESDLRNEVTDVEIKGNKIVVVLYDDPGFKSKRAYVMDYQDKTHKLPDEFNDDAESARVFKFRGKLRDLLEPSQSIRDRTEIYDIRDTTPGREAASFVEGTFAKGNERKATWDYLELNIKDHTLHGKLKVRHRQKNAGQILYSETNEIEFEYNLVTGSGDTTISWNVPTIGEIKVSVKDIIGACAGL